MKVYIASRSQEVAKEIRDAIVEAGHECCSRWVYEVSFGKDKSDEARTEIAVMDTDDVADCDLLIHRSEPDGSYVAGGKHVEMGMALGAGKPVIVIGKRENIFHWHPLVTVVDSAESAIRHMGESDVPKV